MDYVSKKQPLTNEYKIMVVDDEPDILDLLEKALRMEGFNHIVKADNGLKAVNFCREEKPEAREAIRIGALKIEPDGCQASKGGKEIELTAREFEILTCLAENKGRVISRERLYETIWGEDSFGCDNTVMVHIRHLREKIEDNPNDPQYIVTMKGLGYKLVNPNEK